MDHGRSVSMVAGGASEWPCTSAQFGRDPAYGAKKQCAYTEGHNATWKACATNKGTCWVDELAEVRFILPANGANRSRLVWGGIGCDHPYFNGDPAGGNGSKICESRPPGQGSRLLWYNYDLTKGQGNSVRAMMLKNPEDIVPALKGKNKEFWINEIRTNPQFKSNTDIVKRILDNAETRPTMLEIIKSSPGEFDTTMNTWCPQHLDQDVCSCYQQMPASAPAELRVLSSKPQCWNNTCNISGYKNANLKNDQSACGNITVCKQDVGMMDLTKLNMNNVMIKQDCSGSPAGGAGAGALPTSQAPSVVTPTNTSADPDEPDMDSTFIIGGYAIDKMIVYIVILAAAAIAAIMMTGGPSGPPMPMPMPMPMPYPMQMPMPYGY
jgi:hypothetical protein